MHAIGEQQSKRTQSGSNNRSGRDREQQLKRMQVASMQHAAAEVGAIGEQQLEAGRKQGATVEADAIGPGSNS